MQAAPTAPGSTSNPVTPSSAPQNRRPRVRSQRPLLPIEQQHQDATFRSERSPTELELEAIDAETASMQTSGWTTHS